MSSLPNHINFDLPYRHFFEPRIFFVPKKKYTASPINGDGLPKERRIVIHKNNLVIKNDINKI
jgi:hypothetical protein